MPVDHHTDTSDLMREAMAHNGQHADAPALTAWPLTDDERELLDMIQTIERQIHELHIQPLQARYARFLRRIETRLELPPTPPGQPPAYELDAAAGLVRARAAGA